MKQTQPIETGIAVVDVELMLDFYSTVLDCKELRRSDIPEQMSSALTVAQEGYLNIWLQTPNQEIIKLMAPPQAPTIRKTPEFLAAQTGIAYLTFYCSDLDATLAKAESKGGILRSSRDLLNPDNPLRLCFFSDPEGNVIELVEVSAG
tara:strand:+ start:546 stop:989 length:444 start_codon:yes stop_codon:yes gene_type:complete